MLGNHHKIALQFSGGKDSIACLWQMRSLLHRVTVYHVSTGAEGDDAKAAVAWAKEHAPHFVQIDSRRPEGTIASDVVPSSGTAIGLLSVGRAGPVVIDRFSCCAQTIMIPMHERMRADGITLIVRGQKLADKRKSALRTGDKLDGFEFLFPIEGWTDDDVFAYLREHNLPMGKCYSDLGGMPDCLDCSAWWDERRGDWLRRAHPEQAVVVSDRLRYIRDLINEDMRHLQ